MQYYSISSAQTYNVFKGDTINRTDSKGLKQGLWKKYFSNDTLFSEGVYKNNIHTGTFKTYYKSGKTQSILKFRGISEINYVLAQDWLVFHPYIFLLFQVFHLLY